MNFRRGDNNTKQKARVFFLLFTLACLGLSLALAFTSRGAAAKEIPRPVRIGENRVPLLQWQEQFTLNINILSAMPSCKVVANKLEMTLYPEGDQALFSAEEQFLDQNLSVRQAGAEVFLTVELGNLPPFFSLRPTDRGYSIQWLEAGLKGKRIALDPGHGGTDPGAVGRHLGLLEKDVTLPIALKLRALLEKAGAEVFMTRTTDALLDPEHRQGRSVRPDLLLRRDSIDAYSPDFSISIHHNSWKTGDVRGLETYYNPGSLNGFLAKEAAVEIHRVLLETLQRRDRGIKDKKDLVLQVKAPAVLAEILYISNKEEEALLAAPDFPEQAAKALFRGIAAYFQDPGGE